MPNVAHLYSELGDVYARAAEGRRQFWGQAIAGITGIPSQIIAAKQAQQKEQRKAAYDDAHLALERAQVALEQGKVERADREYKLSQQLNGYENAITTAAMASGKWSDDAALQHARTLNDPRAVPIAHKLNQQNQPKLTEHDPEKALRDQAGNIVVPPQPKPLTYGTPQPAMVNGKRQMVRTASDGSLVDLQGRKVEGATVTPDEPPMSEYQREEVKLGRERLNKEGQEPLVAIVGPDGQSVLVPRSQAVGKRPANAREQGRPVTSGDAGKIAEYDSSLDDLKTLRTTLSGSGATGIGAQIAASVPYVTQLTGWGADAKERQAVIDRVKQVIGKALEGGVLRKEDETKYEKILPRIGDAPEVAASKLEGLDKAIRQKRARHLESLGDAGYDTSRFERTESTTPNADTGALKEGTLGTVKGVPAVWKTVNGKAGWYAR